MATTFKNLEVITSNLFNNLLALYTFALAGNASISIHSVKTGQRFSYHITVAKKRTPKGGYKAAHGVGPWDVQVMGADGWEDLGYILKGKRGLRFINAPRLRSHVVSLGKGTPQVSAFTYFTNLLQHGDHIPKGIQVWRGDNCGRCNKELVSEFRHIGYGPVCCKHLGIDAPGIFKRLATLGSADESHRVEVVREMVYRALSKEDTTVINLLPGVAGEYGRAHLAA